MITLFDPLVDLFVTLLAESIAQKNEIGRGALARAVRVMPLLCTESRNLSRANPRVAWLLAFCDYLFDTGKRSRYHDGLPPAINLSNHDNVVVVESAAVLEVGAIHQRRKAIAFNENQANVAVGIPDAHFPNDMPVEVVNFALRLLESHAAFEQNPRYHRYFKPCQRKSCTRPAMVRLPPPPPQSCDDDDDDDDYWKSAGGTSARLPKNMSFCCQGCFDAVDEEYERDINVLNRPELHAPLPPRTKASAESPARLYRAALVRNASLARRLRAEPAKTKHFPLTAQDESNLRQEFTDVLNVDVGVLYAAAVVFELPARIRPKTELPTTLDWRKGKGSYTRAAQRVRSIYKQSGATSMAIGGEKWLGKVKAESLNIF